MYTQPINNKEANAHVFKRLVKSLWYWNIQASLIINNFKKAFLNKVESNINQNI